MADMKLSMLLSVVDRASAPLKAVAGAFANAAKSGEGLKKLGETLRIARENVADFTQRGQAALQSLGRIFKATAKAGEDFADVAKTFHDARENIADFTERGKAALQSIVAPAKAVDTAMAQIRPTVELMGGDTTAVLEAVKQAALDWSKAHVGSAESYIAATNEMITAGLDQKAAVESAAAAMRVANATQGDAAAIAKTLGMVYGQVGDRTKPAAAEMEHLADVLTRAQQVFRMSDLGALPDTMKEALPLAKQYGVSIEQVMTYLGQLERAGIKGGEAGAGLAATLQSLEGASKQLGFSLAKTADGGLDLVGTLSNLAAKVGDVNHITPDMQAKLTQAFGPGAKQILTLIGQTDQLQQALGKVGDAAGAAGRASDQMDNSLSGQLTQVNQAFDGMKVQLAEGFLPALRELIPLVTKAASAIGSFAKDHPTITALGGSILMIAIGAGMIMSPVLSAAGSIASLAASAAKARAGLVATNIELGATGAAGEAASGGLLSSLVPAVQASAAAAWEFAAALLANPITWIVIGIVAAAVLIYKYWEPIKGFFVGLWNEIKDAFKGSFVGGVMKVLMFLSPLYWIVRAFQAVWPWMKSAGAKALSALWDGIKSVGSGALGFLDGIWHDITSSFDKGVIQGLMKLFELFSPLAWLVKAFDAVTQWLFGFSLIDEGKSLIDSMWQGLKSDFGSGLSFLSGLWDSITSGFDDGVVQGIMNILAMFNPVVLIAKGIDAIGQYLFGVSFVDAGAKMVNTIWEGIKSVASKPVEAMTDIVASVRALLPFSPAKAGPLRDLHRVKLVETLASAVKPAPLVNAMTGVMGAAMGAVNSAPMPEFAPMPAGGFAPPAAAGAGAGGAGNVSMNVTINLGGGAGGSAVAELETWLRQPENARRVSNAVQAHASREARTAYT